MSLPDAWVQEASGVPGANRDATPLDAPLRRFSVGEPSTWLPPASQRVVTSHAGHCRSPLRLLAVTMETPSIERGCG